MHAAQRLVARLTIAVSLLVVLGAVSEVTERISGRLAGAGAGPSSALARSGPPGHPLTTGPAAVRVTPIGSRRFARRSPRSATARARAATAAT